jgi:hypothetical protein
VFPFHPSHAAISEDANMSVRSDNIHLEKNENLILAVGHVIYFLVNM